MKPFKFKTTDEALVRVQRIARRHRANAKREAGKAVRERMDAERDGRSGDAQCASRAHAWLGRGVNTANKSECHNTTWS